MRKRLSAAALVLSGLLVVANPVSAGRCGGDYCWGALALGDFGAAGRATGLRSAPEAAEKAQKSCGPRCGGFEVFVNSCAAFAEDSTGFRSFGWAEADRETAEAHALSACEAHGKGCRIRIWACSK